MIYNATPRGHVRFRWGSWWWSIERPGDVLHRAWAGLPTAGAAGDAVLVRMAELKLAADRLVANTHYAG